MDRFIKYAVRQVLAWLASQLEAAQETPTGLDDELWGAAYDGLRSLAVNQGWIDDGGQDDPGPDPRDGGGGGPG